MIRKILLLILFFLIPTSLVNANQSIPNAHLRVGVQQKENGKLDKGIHILELTCWNGQCWLSSVSLNQCNDSELGSAFYPIAQRSSTAEGNLKVENVSNALVVQEIGSDIGGEYTTNLRFEYQPIGQGETASKLIGFTGGFVKNSTLAKQSITCDYVPFKKWGQAVKLDCGVLVPGIESD